MNRCSIPLSFRPLSPKFVGSTNTFRHSCRRHQSVVAQKVEQSAQTIPDPIPVPDNGATHVLVPKPNPRTKTKIISGTRVAKPDPHQFLATELSQLQDNLLNLLGAAHPGLSQIAQCYYLNPTKQLRPLLVLLFSRATNGLGTDWEVKKLGADEERERGLFEELSRPLRQAETLNEWNPSMPDDTASFENIFEMRLAKRKGHTEWKSGTMKPELLSTSNASHQTQPRIVNSSLILPSQLRLAHIVEMVNVASSLHENTTDADSSTPSSFGFGNKLSILGGDFLLGRASTALSRLGSNEVVELIASVISNLVEGEILQMHQIKTPALGVYPGPNSIDEAWKLYLKKTYFKTASLMAKGARAATVLGGCRRDDIWSDVAYDYSRNLGFAYQVWMKFSCLFKQNVHLGLAC